MRKMKKALAVMLAATMTMSMGMTAFAENELSPAISASGKTSLEVVKNYTIQNEGTTYTDATFDFTVVAQSVVDSQYTEDTVPMPYFVNDNDVSLGSTGSITFTVPADENAEIKTEDSITLQLPNYYYVGKYTYLISETKPTSELAGVQYNTSGNKTLLVTVYYEGDTLKYDFSVRDEKGEKVGGSGEKYEPNIEFDNNYRATDLTIEKQVTGAMGDKQKYFAFVVTLTAAIPEEGKKIDYRDSYTISGGSEIPKELGLEQPTSIEVGGSQTVYLKHGDTITIENLPYGVGYEVKEYNEGYGVTISASDTADESKATVTGTIDNSTENMTFTNNKDGKIDTGIVLDNAPYILLLALAAFGMFGFVSKKRSMEF